MKTKSSVASNLHLNPDCSEGVERVKLMDLVYPIIRLNQYLGTCPMTFSRGHLIFSWRSKNCIYTLFALLLMTAYFLCTVAQVAFVLIYPSSPSSSSSSNNNLENSQVPTPTSIPPLFISSSFASSISTLEDESVIPQKIVRLVTLGSRVFSTLIPIIALVLIFPNRESYIQFFEKLEAMRQPLGHMMNCSHSVRTSRRSLFIYSILATCSTSLVFFNAWIHPRSEGFVLFFYPGNVRPPTYWIVIGAIFQAYIVLIQYSLCAIIETMMTILAASMTDTVKNLLEEMAENGFSNPGRLKSNDYNYNHRQRIQIGSALDLDTDVHRRKTSVVKEIPDSAFIISASYWNYGFSQTSLRMEDNNWINNSMSQQRPLTIVGRDKLKGGDEMKLRINVLKKAISGFHCITRIQNLINSVFGSVMALNTALHVLLTCFISFLVIMNFDDTSQSLIGFGSASTPTTTTTTSNESTTEKEAGIDTEINGSDSQNSPLQLNLNFDCLIMLGFMLCVLVRLLLVFVSLGNFHHTSLRFTEAVSEKYMHLLLWVPKPNVQNQDGINDGSGDKKRREDGNLLSRDLHVIGAFLNSQLSNPCSFSAGGFFTFSRQSLLTTFSIILTYVIFLFQAK